MRRFAKVLTTILLLSLPFAAQAHVGSKDVYQTVHAGPYTFYVTVRPPNVIPGVAAVEIRSTGAAVSTLKITPLPVTGEASRHPPASDTMQQDANDKNFFTGTVWIMARGTWQVRMEAAGSGGDQVATVPVVAVPVAVLRMERPLGWALGLLGLFLVISMAGVVAASVREARLAPGVEPTPARRRHGALALAGSLAVMALAVYAGGYWWNVEAADYAEHLFVPTQLHATLAGNTLDLSIPPPKADKFQPLKPQPSGFLPDHGHLMHLYAIRMPEMDAAFHLHPSLLREDEFTDRLPVMPPGHYQLYGDVVHSTGFPETLLATIDVPENMAGAALAPEDAAARPAPLRAGLLGDRYRLADGYSMVWDRPATLTANAPYAFHFTLVDPAGKPATRMQPYLGMAGHAAFVKTDGSVFAHTHPEGSAAMADVMLANESLGPATSTPMDMSMDRSAAPGATPAVGPSVEFPYGFPRAGRYRIFIQMKHDDVVETGVFDAEVR